MPFMGGPMSGGQQPGWSLQGGSGAMPWQNPTPFNQKVGNKGSTDTGGGFNKVDPQNPNLTNNWNAYLNSQIGQGLPAFNQQTMLPWGQLTQSGQLNAPLNPLMQQIFQGLQGGQTNVPGLNTLSTIANQGIRALPVWNQMVQAAQQGIDKGSANLREQMAFGGNLAGSPFGTAMAQYGSQTQADLNSMLGQLQFQGIGDQLQAAQGLAGMGAGIGEYMQGLGQQNISNMYNAWQQTLPQYNPMNQMIQQAAFTYPPTFQRAGDGGGIFGGLMQGLGGLMGGLGGLFGL
jgi:hypothetical protein